MFTRLDYRDFLVQNLSHCQEKEGLEIYAYVIMSNHFHMIARSKEADLVELFGRFKSFTAKKIIENIEANQRESRKDWLMYLFKFFAKVNKQYS